MHCRRKAHKLAACRHDRQTLHALHVLHGEPSRRGMGMFRNRRRAWGTRRTGALSAIPSSLVVPQALYKLGNDDHYQLMPTDPSPPLCLVYPGGVHANSDIQRPSGSPSTAWVLSLDGVRVDRAFNPTQSRAPVLSRSPATWPIVRPRWAPKPRGHPDWQSGGPASSPDLQWRVEMITGSPTQDAQSNPRRVATLVCSPRSWPVEGRPRVPTGPKTAPTPPAATGTRLGNPTLAPSPLRCAAGVLHGAPRRIFKS